jgi:hypothetical protein
MADIALFSRTRMVMTGAGRKKCALISSGHTQPCSISSMQADYEIELGPDAPALEVPWRSPEGSVRYFDLRERPELLLEISEAAANPELARFLSAVNSSRSHFQSAKCDSWLSDEISEAEAVYESKWKFASYVDLIFADPSAQADLERHRTTTSELAKLLSKAPEVSAAADFIVRRCYFHRTPELETSEDGYCITFYLSGYGDDEDQARRRWAIGLELVQHALVQLTQRTSREIGLH